MATPVLVIVVQGGTVQATYSSTLDQRIIIADYDNEPDINLSDLLEMENCEYHITPES